jgi:hypothetical protein
VGTGSQFKAPEIGFSDRQIAAFEAPGDLI